MIKLDFKLPEIVRKPNGDYYVVSPDKKHRLGPFDRNGSKDCYNKLVESMKKVHLRYMEMVNELFQPKVDPEPEIQYFKPERKKRKTNDSEA